MTESQLPKDFNRKQLSYSERELQTVDFDHANLKLRCCEVAIEKMVKLKLLDVWRWVDAEFNKSKNHKYSFKILTGLKIV